MLNSYTTGRLVLNRLNEDDTVFIRELVNTPGWLQFIGDRNVHSDEDALAYVQKIMRNTNIFYWVVRLKEKNTPVGIITFIKREYLTHHDIGFAFLPEHNGKGYAHEAVTAVLKGIIADPAYDRILATTLKENTSSIKLLEKIGLRFDSEIKDGEQPLLLYAAAASDLVLD